jgi:translation elongation factor P/translation initiation factor 5A
MKLLTGLRRRRALKKYARLLPKQLSKDYGQYQYFTSAQIFLLPKETFDQLPSQTPMSPNYADGLTGNGRRC